MIWSWPVFFFHFFILLMVFWAQAMFEYFTQKEAKNDVQTMDWNSKKSRSKNGSLMNRNRIRSILFYSHCLIHLKLVARFMLIESNICRKNFADFGFVRRMKRITCESKHQQLLLIQTYIENKETKIKQGQLIRLLTLWIFTSSNRNWESTNFAFINSWIFGYLKARTKKRHIHENFDV